MPKARVFVYCDSETLYGLAIHLRRQKAMHISIHPCDEMNGYAYLDCCINAGIHIPRVCPFVSPLRTVLHGRLSTRYIIISFGASHPPLFFSWAPPSTPPFWQRFRSDIVYFCHMAAGLSSFFPVLPIFFIISIVLLLLPVPGFVRGRNVAVLFYITWLLLGNAVYFINMLVWRGIVIDVAPIYCDIGEHFCELDAIPQMLISGSVTFFLSMLPFGIACSLLCVNKLVWNISRSGNLSVRHVSPLSSRLFARILIPSRTLDEAGTTLLSVLFFPFCMEDYVRPNVSFAKKTC